MSNIASDPSFAAAHRDRLKKLGVVEAQIEDLQNHALPAVRVLLRLRPTLAEVRTELTGFGEAVKDLTNAIVRINCGVDGSAQSEACERITVEHWNAELDDGDVFDDLLIRLEILQLKVKRAAAALPSTQRRQLAAKRQPVKEIDDALRSGFVRHHQEAGEEVVPPYTLHTSSSPGSPFREIVGICYAAVGANGDPERAIKNYLAARPGKGMGHERG